MPFRLKILYCLLLLFVTSNIEAQKVTDSVVQIQKADSLLSVVRAHYYDKDYKNAIEKGNELLKLSEEIGNQKKETAAYSLIGNSLLQRGDTIESQKIFEKSLSKAKTADNLEYIIIASIDLGNVYALSQQYEKAINNYTEVLPLAEKLNKTIYLFLLNYNIGESYLELNLTKSAAKFIQASETFVNNQAVAYRASQKSLSGKYYFAIDDFSEASLEFEEGIQLGLESDFTEILLEIYEYYSLTEERRGNYKKANELLRKFNELNEEKYKLDKIKAVEDAVAKFKVNQIEQELLSTKYENEIAQQKASRNTLLISGALVLISLFGFLLFLLYTQSKRKKLLISLKEKNKLLILAKEKSDRLRKSKDALFSRISHELRTPMYGIIGISNLMVENEKEAVDTENIKSLKYSADYLLSLINNVLEMNKMSRIKDDLLKKEDFDMRKVCNYAIDSARYISQNNSNTYELKVDEQIPEMVKGDASRLSQVLINLLGNSSKFTKHGTVRLQLNLQSLDDDTCCVFFLIMDNGIGIAPERLSRIFEDSSTVEHHNENEGTGLGLPISKRIIELHDSDISIESELNKGTIISFTICYQIPARSAVEQKSNHNQDISILRNKQILVVEDNKINQVVTKKTLEKLGIEVEIAESGEEAIQMAGLNPYDLILMDINMPPGIDGFETAKRIREFNATVPIIALTAVEQKEIKKRMKDSAMNDYIIKPFKGTDFENKLVQSLTNDK